MGTSEAQVSTSLPHGAEENLESQPIHGAGYQLKEVVFEVDVKNDKQKARVMKKVSDLRGVSSLSMDMGDKKLTVIGDIDPISIIGKLRKVCHTELVSVGPAKEDKIDGNKKDKKDDKKDKGPAKEDKNDGYKNNKKDDKKDKKQEEEVEQLGEAYRAYNYYNPYMEPHYSVEENPNACVIC